MREFLQILLTFLTDQPNIQHNGRVNDAPLLDRIYRINRIENCGIRGGSRPGSADLLIGIDRKVNGMGNCLPSRRNWLDRGSGFWTAEACLRELTARNQGSAVQRRWAPWPLVGHASGQNFLDRINKIYRIDKRGNNRNWHRARSFQPREGRRNLAQGDRREPWEKGKDSFFKTQPPKGVTEKRTEFLDRIYRINRIEGSGGESAWERRSPDRQETE